MPPRAFDTGGGLKGGKGTRRTSYRSNPKTPRVRALNSGHGGKISKSEEKVEEKGEKKETPGQMKRQTGGRDANGNC